jgi:hypothetical protein
LASASRDLLGRPARLETQLKRGRRRNEMTLFRYDALLRLDAEALPPPSTVLDWQREELTPPLLRRRLAAGEADDLALERIPNARLVEEVEALRLLREPEPADGEGPLATAADLEATVRRARLRGVEPEDLWALERHGARVRVGWQCDGADGLMRARIAAGTDDQDGEPGQ